MQPPDWNLAQSFLAVMRGGSLSAAARSLGTAQATVRRHVEALEQAIGAALFVRTQSGLLPTEAALAALPHAEAMEAGIAALARSARGAGGIDGTVRVTCSEVIGVEVLPPILAALLQEHPGLDVELAPTNAVQDLIRRDADIAVRMTRPTQAAIVARKIGSVTIGLFAHLDYLADRPAIDSIGDLTQHRLIGGDRTDQLAAILVESGAPSPRFALRCDSDLAQLAALRAGIGIGVCQVPLASLENSLIPILPAWRVHLDIWLAVHEDLRATPRVRAALEAISTGLSAYLAGSAGVPRVAG
jgi:DNA-binding transcriptional LysR family regulator